MGGGHLLANDLLEIFRASACRKGSSGPITRIRSVDIGATLASIEAVDSRFSAELRSPIDSLSSALATCVTPGASDGDYSCC